MKFTANAVAFAFALPRAAQSLAPTLKTSGACAAPLATEAQCAAAAGDLGAWWSAVPIDPDNAFAAALPGGCFAVDRPGKTLKVRWNAHKAEGTGCGATRPCVCGPSCAPDAVLAARYGAQLCPDEIEAKFVRKDDAFIMTTGMPLLKNPEYRAPLSDGFTDLGLVGLDLEQAASVCVTKCENDPNCDAVAVKVMTDLTKVVPYTGKTETTCLMVNNDLGPGAYLVEGGLCTCSDYVTFEKKVGTPVPNFEEVQCNTPAIPGYPAGNALQVAIGCYTGQINQDTSPSLYPLCGQATVLTPDFHRFMAPGIQCLAEKSAGAAVQPCLECLDKYEDGTIADVCRENATDTSTYLLDPDKCLDECLGTACLEELETNLLCFLASPGVRINAGRDTNFTCPTFD